MCIRITTELNRESKNDEGEKEMMMNENSMYCVYMTPCKYCAKFDKWCEKKCKSKKSSQATENNAVSENTEKILNQAGEYAVKFAENHGMSVAEAMEHPMVKSRFEVFNQTER